MSSNVFLTQQKIKLYSLIPEMRDLDNQIGLYINPIINFNTVKNIYNQELSKSGNINDLFINKPQVVINYITQLEQKYFLFKNSTEFTVNYDNILPAVVEKITLLETALSNLEAVSMTQQVKEQVPPTSN
jgi:hypothetical protein